MEYVIKAANWNIESDVYYEVETYYSLTNQIEFWKEIVGFDGYYVSNQGRVKRIYQNGKELILKYDYIRNGNKLKPKVLLYKEGKAYHFYVSRLVSEAFQSLVDGMEVHHVNKDSQDNRLSNLMTLTKEEHKELHKRLRDVEKEESQ